MHPLRHIEAGWAAVSADLLRRAATRLRESALAAEVALPQATSGAAVDWPDAMNGWLGGPIGEFAALVHPPVALALADHLEHVADDMSDDHAREEEFPRRDGGTYTAVVDRWRTKRWDWTSALAVARAVLREPEGGDRT